MKNKNDMIEIKKYHKKTKANQHNSKIVGPPTLKSKRFGFNVHGVHSIEN